MQFCSLGFELVPVFGTPTESLFLVVSYHTDALVLSIILDFILSKGFSSSVVLCPSALS